jgi:branched-subunit amino acid aminotransferase/4-amino-4-deoxychorismate lyase
MEKADKIWMDGTMVDWNDAHVHLVSNTLQYGFGVFEGKLVREAQRKMDVAEDDLLDRHLGALSPGAHDLRDAGLNPNIS